MTKKACHIKNFYLSNLSLEKFNYFLKKMKLVSHEYSSCCNGQLGLCLAWISYMIQNDFQDSWHLIKTVSYCKGNTSCTYYWWYLIILDGTLWYLPIYFNQNGYRDTIFDPYKEIWQFVDGWLSMWMNLEPEQMLAWL